VQEVLKELKDQQDLKDQEVLKVHKELQEV
jgi:hypothetical protein